MQFSANLGFLWNDRPLPNAIRAAKQAGFDAVECHWPYDIPADHVKAALDETGLPMLGLNTARGDIAAGEFGLSALPGREDDARQAIDDAVTYAMATGTRNIHVMAGFANGLNAHETFLANLLYACDLAQEAGITILIEPLNHYDAPGYFLSTTTEALSLIRAARRNNLKLMFDCYHVQLVEGNVTKRLQNLLPHIGHIQFASVPDRGAPDHGELDYQHIFKVIHDLGYRQPLGAEYKPGAAGTDAGLGWKSNLHDNM